MGQLNELQIKAASPRDKEYLLADGEGLYLRVRPSGKVWVYRYKRHGKEAKLSLGRYPVVTLAAARKKVRAEAEKRSDGVDPREARRVAAERERVAHLNTFERMSRVWHAQAQKDREWSASYAQKVMRHLELHVFPWIGALAMETIAPTEVVRCLHRIKERGNLETAQRVREAVQHVFQYAVDVGALDPSRNFVSSRTGGLPPPRARPTRPLRTRRNSGSCSETCAPTTATSSPVQPCCFHHFCSSGQVNCGWRIGRTSTLNRRCGAARRRR